jgi:hypothetical protein
MHSLTRKRQSTTSTSRFGVVLALPSYYAQQRCVKTLLIEMDQNQHDWICFENIGYRFIFSIHVHRPNHSQDDLATI